MSSGAAFMLSSAWAVRAVEGRTARLDDAPDGGFTALGKAGLALPAVDLKGVAEVAQVAFDVDEVADARASGVNRLYDDVVGCGSYSLDSFGHP